LPAHVGRTLLQLRQPARALRAAPVYTARFERQWQMASFSALVRSLAAPDRWTAARYAAGDDETPAADAVPTLASLRAADAAPATVSPGAAVTGAAAWHRWPRGPAAGQFLHEQLEWLAGEAFALALSPELQRQLLLRCQRQGLGDEGPALLDWMLALLAQPLAPLGVALRDLERPLPEMEFWLPCAGLPSARVDALCRAHVMPGRDRPALPDGTWRGLLMGFADLVFEHGGRYWVLDYKSNRLGDDDGDYTEAALEAAMAAHRYDVQAAIYLLALHRLLRARLGPRYQPAQQLGGALFYFLRGLRGPAGGCYRVRPEAALIAGMDALLPQAEGGA
jgi:exodeoxyribonuclease V beta subunit